MTFEELKNKFAGKCIIKEGPGGLPVVAVSNAAATAEICLMGAHIMSYAPNGQGEVIWMSSQSSFEVGKAIRGGIPVCWPWFSKNPTFEDAPMHGLARITTWELLDVFPTEKQTIIKLALNAVPGYEQYWGYKFRLEYTITVGATLTLSLKTTNLDDKPFTITEALHTYFSVGDVTKVQVEGLDGCPYLNKVGDGGTGIREGNRIIDCEVDEVYQGVRRTLVIRDASIPRTILVNNFNSNSAVVWNPWIAKSQRMADFPDDGYKTMLCVESGNVIEDAREIQPGASHELIAVLTVKR